MPIERPVPTVSDPDTSGFWAAQVAALDTRDRKEDVDLTRLREDWRARAAEHGFGRAELASTMHRAQCQEPSSRELSITGGPSRIRPRPAGTMSSSARLQAKKVPVRLMAITLVQRAGLISCAGA